MPKNRNKS